MNAFISIRNICAYHPVDAMPIQCKRDCIVGVCSSLAHSRLSLRVSVCLCVFTFVCHVRARVVLFQIYLSTFFFSFPPLDLASHTSVFYSTIHFVFWSRVILLLLHWPLCVHSELILCVLFYFFTSPHSFRSFIRFIFTSTSSALNCAYVFVAEWFLFLCLFFLFFIFIRACRIRIIIIIILSMVCLLPPQ